MKTLAALVLLAATAVAQQDFFPLAKGNLWVYEGTVKWEPIAAHARAYEPGDEKLPATISKRVRWRMQVLDVVTGADFHAALIEGAPWNLSMYGQMPESEIQQMRDILVVVGANTYLPRRDGWELFSTLKRDGLTSEVRERLQDSIWYRTPFLPDAYGLYCPRDQEGRPDRMYCWAVDGIGRRRISGIKGLRPSTQQVITLAFRTNPDHEFVDLALGTGILHFEYVHHGSVSEVDVHLVEFHPGTSDVKQKYNP